MRTLRRGLEKRTPLSDGMRRYLLTGEYPGPETPPPRMDVFTLLDEQKGALWAEWGAELTREHVRERPGTRPWGWWAFDAPGPRDCVGGAFESEPHYLRRHALLAPGERRRITLGDYDPVDLFPDITNENEEG